jgi:hypothetical protein
VISRAGLESRNIRPDELTNVFDQLAGCADVAGDGALRRAAQLAVEVDCVAAEGDAVRFAGRMRPQPGEPGRRAAREPADRSG